MRRTVFALLSCLLAVSCIENVDFGPELRRKLTVNCILSGNDSIQKLDLKYSGSVGDMFYDAPEEADVRLYADGAEVGRFEKESFARWTLDLEPEAGTTYRLEVKVPGEGEFSAETVMPAPAPVVKRGYSSDQLKTYAQLHGAPPFWMFITRGNSLERRIATNHPYVDGFNALDYIIFTDFGGNGHYPEHLGYLRIGETDFEDEMQFYVEGFQNNVVLVARAVSPEYDRYLKSSLTKAMAYLDVNDPTRYLEENTVYCNIEGGLGIFGAFVDVRIPRNAYTDPPKP